MVIVMQEGATDANLQHVIDRLVASGFNPSTIADPLYFHDPRSHSFRPLDSALYEGIMSGSVRL